MLNFIKWLIGLLGWGKKDVVVRPTGANRPYPKEGLKDIPEDYYYPNALLGGVDEDLLMAATAIIDELRSQGWHATIHNAMRTQAQANANAASGVGIKNSKHVKGRAVDIIDRRYGWDIKYINEIRSFRLALGKEVSRYPNLTWGGNWHKSYGELGDWAHVELK